MIHYVIDLVGISNGGNESSQVVYVSSDLELASRQLRRLKDKFEQEGWEFQESDITLQGSECLHYFESADNNYLPVFGEDAMLQLILNAYPEDRLITLEEWSSDSSNL